MGERLTTALPLAALQMAFAGRSPPPGVIDHSDRGSHYTRRLSHLALRKGGALPSIGKNGDGLDHAVVESFFSPLKRELLLDHVFHTRQEGRNQVFGYLEVFYHRQRRHSTLGCKTPREFEQLSIHAVASLQVRKIEASSHPA